MAGSSRIAMPRHAEHDQKPNLLRLVLPAHGSLGSEADDVPQGIRLETQLPAGDPKGEVHLAWQA